MDRRYDVKTTDEMFGAICDHLKHATNGGTIRSTITVFRQVRIPYNGGERVIDETDPINYALYVKYPHNEIHNVRQGHLRPLSCSQKVLPSDWKQPKTVKLSLSRNDMPPGIK